MPPGAGEGTEEPREARQAEQKPSPALRSAPPRREPRSDEDDPDGEVGGGEPDLGRGSGGLERRPPECGPLGEEPESDRRRQERRPVARALRDESGERRAGEVALREEAACSRGLHARAVRGGVSARDQHDPRWIRRGREPLGDREPVEVGQLDVEQNHVRPQPVDGGERPDSIGRLADDGESFRLEQRPRRRPKARRGRRRSGRASARRNRRRGSARAHCGQPQIGRPKMPVQARR